MKSAIINDNILYNKRHKNNRDSMSELYNFEEIKNDSTIKRFLKIKSGLQPPSIEAYLYVIKEFCNFNRKSPTEIHDLHRDDLRNRVPEFDMWLNEAKDNYVSFLIDRNHPYSTIQNHLIRINGFFHAFKLRPTPKTNIPIKQVSEDSKYSLTVEDIRKAIKNSKPIYQTLFITMAQTGLAVGDALLLDVEDFILAVSKNGEDLTVKEAIYRVKSDDNIIGCFDLRRKKTNVEFYTFVGPEALRSIASLLEVREAEYLTPETPIFIKEISRISKEDCLDDLRLKVKAVNNYTHRMHDRRNIFPRIEVGGKERNYFRSHKIRKWYSNQLRFKAGFSSDDVKYLMGQNTGDVLEHYIDTNNYNALKGNYRKALPYLAVNDEIVLEENQEALEKLEAENALLKEQMKKQEEYYKSELVKLSDRVDSIEESKEEREVDMETLKESMRSINTLAEVMVPKDAENRYELVSEKAKELIDEFWKTLPVAQPKNDNES